MRAGGLLMNLAGICGGILGRRKAEFLHWSKSLGGSPDPPPCSEKEWPWGQRMAPNKAPRAPVPNQGCSVLNLDGWQEAQSSIVGGWELFEL